MENNNYIPDQYKEVLEKLNKEINGVKEEIITKDAKIEKIAGLFYEFMTQNFPKGTDSTYLINIISDIIGKQHVTNA